MVRNIKKYEDVNDHIELVRRIKDVMDKYKTSDYVCIHYDKTFRNVKAATQFLKTCDNCNSTEDMQKHLIKKESANATKR